MSAGKKGIAIMLLQKHDRGERDGDEEAEDGEEPGMPPLEDVMGELRDAFKSGDMKAAAQAFRGAMACAEDHEAHDEEDESEEGDSSY